MLLGVALVVWAVLLVFCVVLWRGYRSVVVGRPAVVVVGVAEWLGLLQTVLVVLEVVVGLVQVAGLQGCVELRVEVVVT